MTDRIQLAALLGSRICHDLISPIGAIGNGVELLMLESGAKSPEMLLIAESVAHASARIRYFRVAFGAATIDQRIGSREMLTILHDSTRGSRISIGWDGPGDLARAEVKLAFLAILCLESAMPFGGRIALACGDAWTVEGSSVKLRADPGLWSVLVAGDAGGNDGHEVAPAMIHFPLLAQEAATRGHSLAVEITDEAIRIRF